MNWGAILHWAGWSFLELWVLGMFVIGWALSTTQAIPSEEEETPGSC